MPFGGFPASAANGLLGELYRDLKYIGRISFEKFAQPIRQDASRRELLASFHKDFPKHDPALTDLVSYSEWHESDKDWREGKGLWCAATFGELPHIWTNVERFAAYEAGLLRFHRAGGEARRTFVIGADMHPDITRYDLYRTLRRHEALGFKPHVCSVLDLRRATEQLGVNCDTVVSFNSRIVYLTRSLDEGDPIMVRSVDMRLANRIEHVVSRLWKGSRPAQEFLRDHNWNVPDSIHDQIARDIETVEELARPVS